ncbi:hypothetical protein AAFF_G00262930 [Aldrovandia affinis]|uniref:Uncharacterized protein n=1 Tax=Aldrovandia affinis TaxID=143900 RepID=A0AAD7SSM3_9TELE|nr:hypothetical protein AAFF_G00262930 [Aldrovandia affinis]
MGHACGSWDGRGFSLQHLTKQVKREPSTSARLAAPLHLSTAWPPPSTCHSPGPTGRVSAGRPLIQHPQCEPLRRREGFVHGDAAC